MKILIDLIDSFDIHDHLIANPISTFLCRVAGDSMQEEAIYPGDIVVVDRSLDPKEGKIVVAAVNGEFTLKKLIKGLKNWELHPSNRQYPILVLDEHDELTIFGTVVGVVRKLK